MILTASLALIIAAQAGLPGTAGEVNWAAKNAELTTDEFLNLLFRSEYQPYHTIARLKVSFVPGQSPADAVLFILAPIVVPEPDLPTGANLEKSLENQASIFRDIAARLLESPQVKKRWPGATIAKNFVIRFTDANVKGRTIAIFAADRFESESEIIEGLEGDLKPRIGEPWNQ
ncbi:MAG: hypothetical protein IPM23_15675 [Candidatus Melainabacteria bacterium]|nr:hypothetical protein [Candidatus Melainabacteria bacterium]